MITTIISGGESGVERAALDVAIRHNLEHGGSVSVRPEDESMASKYNIKNIFNNNYANASKQNVEESDGTLVITRHQKMNGQESVEQFAQSLFKPYLRLELGPMSMAYACRLLQQWCMSNGIEVLYVTGPTAEADSEIYELTVKVLESVLKKVSIERVKT